MVVLDEGRTALRDFLAGSSPSAPSHMFWGTSSTSANYTDSSFTDVVHADTFTNTDSSVARQVQFEGVVLSTEATGSTIRQVGLGTETTGTSGVQYLKEDIADIEKNSTFDIQTLIITEITREDGT